MKQLWFDYRKALRFFQERELDQLQADVALAHDKLHQGTGVGHEYLGWIDLPVKYDRAEIERIKNTAAKIRRDSDVLVVVGIGGSYLGTRAAVEMLTHSFHNMLPARKRQGPQILFAGHHISGTYLQELLEYLEDKEVSINVISKSGTTTEPAIAFRILMEFMNRKYGAERAKSRIYVTTDQYKGALRILADENNYESFVIPDDVGGRYSVLTPVGLLPIAASGIDIEEMLRGAADGREWFGIKQLTENPAYQYAAIRNILYRKGKAVEILVNYEPSFHFFAEWWKQLYGESEGKDQKGIFPAAVDFTTDLHSMGQFIQEGRRNIFETVLTVEKPRKDLTIDEDPDNIDGLNFIAGQTMDFVNKKAYQGTLLAHTDGDVPVMVVGIGEITAYYFGLLVYFFEKACGVSGYLNGINPFDQPGVEAYKQNMFALLGKPGFEKERKALLERLQ